MSTPRQLAIEATRPFLRAMVENIPDDVAIVLDAGALVDAVLRAAHPDAVIPPRHRPEEEDVTAYRVNDETRVPDQEGLLPLYALLRTDTTGRAPVVHLDIVEAENAQTAQRCDERDVLNLAMHPDALRTFCMAGIAAADHATSGHRRIAAEREAGSATPAQNTEQD